MGVPTFSCWLVGTESLLAECGSVLIREGHQVLGVATDSERLAEWARECGIPVIDPRADLERELAARPFDYLFAITHLSRLPASILRLPARSAINFHDGPLPDYAGLNAPAWALVHGESRYGVTWHVMTDALDAGPILKQRGFDIARDETSQSLNAKCFAAAIESFAELVAELAAGSARALPQAERASRTFLRHRRPAAACAIDWSRPAAEIEALVRALDFGRYRNPLGLAKLQFGGRAVVVTRALAEGDRRTGRGARAARSAGDAPSPPGTVPTGTDPTGAEPPGTVIAVDAERVLVAAADGAIALLGFAELAGRELDPGEAARRLGLVPGVVLESLAPELAARLTELDPLLSRSERRWAERLSELGASVVPGVAARRDADAELDPQPRALDVTVPPGLARRFPNRPLPLLLLGAFAAYLARLSRLAQFDLGYADGGLREATLGQPWISARAPLHVRVDLEQDLGPLLDELGLELRGARAAGPWLLDLIAREPALAGLRERREPLLPVAFEERAGLGEPALADRAEWVLEASSDGPTGGATCRFVHDARRVPSDLATSLRDGYSALLAGLAADPELPLGSQPMVAADELHAQRSTWNNTELTHRRDVCVNDLFQEQADRTPDATALVCDSRSLTYAELRRRVESLALLLVRRGVGPGQLVGIHLERSVDLVVAILGTLAAGAAYVPLDPAHPADRTAWVLADAGVGVVLTSSHLADSLPPSAAKIVRSDVDVPAGQADRPVPEVAVRPEDLAYAIYTSGSTGRPKGVLVEHRNVASFFAAMDERIPHDPPGVWLAVTSLSFDISVLELLWTLCRGFAVVLRSSDEQVLGSTPSRPRRMEFGLFYFSNAESEGGDGYRLLLDGARFADAHGFSAVWTPERHFHAFGGLYPNPAVTGAAVAAITRNVQIRAGSVVLPLHHPIRVAEEWALVDNLSAGRAAISFASGWHPEDFVLAPGNHADSKAVMFRDLEVVRRLWRGEAVAFPGPDGTQVDVRTLPRPVRAELPVWITAAGNPETFAAAGRIGANVLTHLLGQSSEQLAAKIRAYRAARDEAGFDPATGVVSLMLHTFVGTDEEVVRERVRGPLERYLSSSIDLIRQYSSTFPGFHRHGGARPELGVDLSALDPEERSALLAHACDRYYDTSGLFGTPERCLERIAELQAIDVDEIACLIDFGLPADEVLASLPALDRLRRLVQDEPALPAWTAGRSLAAELVHERVTHLQCTPSLARILCADPEVVSALARVEHVFVGGEALPTDLAQTLCAAVGGTVTNMYGPTETTIWSSMHPVAARTGTAGVQPEQSGLEPIGRPIANTRFHVLDRCLQPLPIGVAGELFIAGDGVARGYLGRPELDAERFLPEAGDAAAGAGDRDARMYRTGDLVRYRADGVLEFLGRVDHQIKLRGQRVEPGEVEACLLDERVSGETLAEVVVVAREDTPGDQRLVAYLVPRRGTPDPERLRRELEARLPAHMVPAHFVVQERLPRTPNGKLDRRALPPPGPPSTAGSSPPSSDLEWGLAELWREALGLESVGVDDNFFDIGGHSLLVVRLHRRIQESLGAEVLLTDLFRFPTVRSLARYLAAGTTTDTVDEASSRGQRRRSASSLRQRRMVER